jgi:hypothetical protein
MYSCNRWVAKRTNRQLQDELARIQAFSLVYIVSRPKLDYFVSFFSVFTLSFLKDIVCPS